jgi:hypothetical protein
MDSAYVRPRPAIHCAARENLMKRDLVIVVVGILSFGLAIWFLWGNPERPSTYNGLSKADASTRLRLTSKAVH